MGRHAALFRAHLPTPMARLAFWIVICRIGVQMLTTTRPRASVAPLGTLRQQLRTRMRRRPSQPGTPSRASIRAALSALPGTRTRRAQPPSARRNNSARPLTTRKAKRHTCMSRATAAPATAGQIPSRFGRTTCMAHSCSIRPTEVTTNTVAGAGFARRRANPTLARRSRQWGRVAAPSPPPLAWLPAINGQWTI